MDNITTTQLLEWHKRGLALLPLHWVEDGRCSCRRPDCRSAGKHPIGTGWQARPRPSWPDVMAWHEETPGCNWGVRTGTPSGVWVLDFDPDNETDGAARALIGAVRLVAPTFEVQTGGGGLHLYFRMPPGWEPTNRRGQLPAGLDVRGTGGQVVIPPSVSGKGPYVVLSDVPPSNAPEWLLDLIRPPEQVSQSSVVQTGNDPYAHAAIERVLIEISHLREGERNQTGWHRARRIRELAAGAGWDGERFRDAFINALMAAGLPYDEALSVWVSSGRAPVTPAGPEPATVIEGVLPPFVVADSPIVMDDNPQFSDPADALLAELLDSSGLAALPPPEWLIDGFLVRNSLARVNGRPGSLKSFSVLDMGLSVATGRAWQGHETKQGRVFCLLAEGASGTAWREQAWRQAHGVGREALGGIRYLPRPVQAAGGEWSVLVEACRRYAPDLIILDTQSRITSGIKENDNSEMARFVERAEELRAATGACVLLVHHAGKGGQEGGRGAEVVFGALTTEMAMERTGTSDYCTLKVIKQKNAPEAEQRMHVRVVELTETLGGITSATEQTSLVLEPVAAESALPSALSPEDPVLEMSSAAAKLLGLFVGAGPFALGDGATKGEARQQFKAAKYGVEKTFYRAWGTLIEHRAIARIAGTGSYRHVPIEDRPTLAEAGRGDWVVSGLDAALS